MSRLLREMRFATKKLQNKKKHTVLESRNISDDCIIGEWCLIGEEVLIAANVSIGNYTYINSGKRWIVVDSNVRIGSFCSIAPGVSIGMGNHNYNYVSTHPFLYNPYYEELFDGYEAISEGLKDVDLYTVIGNDVWIGSDAIIKRGVVIGDGAVIGSGAIVTKDVPDYAIVGGNPAKVIKYRTTAENIKFFSENKDAMWWNWDIKTIKANIRNMYDFDNYRKVLESIVTHGLH